MPFDQQPTLRSDRLLLRPMTPGDFDALYAISSDPLLWEQHPAKERAEETGFTQWFAEALASEGQLVAVDESDGSVVGTSRYWEYAPGEIEIGWTFVARRRWGDGTNAEMKRLMLEHAFASFDTVRFRVHSDNFRSQRAVTKLGASRVGEETSQHGHGQNVVFELSRAAYVERGLATYYDLEGEDRANRALEPRRVERRSQFLASLPAAQRVLEIGIGPGRDAEAFVAGGHTVIGVDLSPVFAQLATKVGAHALVATVRALPFPAASFDAVWSMSTLMHVPDAAIDTALGEVARVLRPGGTAVIGVWGGADAESYLHNPRFDLPRLFARRSSSRWQAMLATVGTVTQFEEWHEAGEDFVYQWAMVRCG